LVWPSPPRCLQRPLVHASLPAPHGSNRSHRSAHLMFQPQHLAPWLVVVQPDAASYKLIGLGIRATDFVCQRGEPRPAGFTSSYARRSWRSVSSACQCHSFACSRQKTKHDVMGVWEAGPGSWRHSSRDNWRIRKSALVFTECPRPQSYCGKSRQPAKPRRCARASHCLARYLLRLCHDDRDYY
jgi:hypothetical protein